MMKTIGMILVLSVVLLAEQEKENPYSNPKGMFIATGAVGTFGAIALTAGIISVNQPYDGGGANIGGGVSILAGTGMLTSSVVMAIITYVKYRKWKKWNDLYLNSKKGY